MPTYSTLVTTSVGAGSFPGGFSPTFAFADINGDGRLDIIAPFSETAPNGPPDWNPAPVMVFLGDGTGRFSDATSTYFPAGAAKVVASDALLLADFNGDGKLDVFIADEGKDAEPFPGSANHLILSSGATYVDASANLPTTLMYNSSAAVVDINGDGKPDVYVASIGGPNGASAAVSPYFLINDGTGHFAVDRSELPTSFADVANHQYPAEAFADLNGDGKVDMVAGVLRLAGASLSNQIFLNDGAGHLTAGTVLPTPFPDVRIDIADIHVVDLNNDGRPDIVVDYEVDTFRYSYAQVLINTGAGGYTDQTASWLPSNMAATNGGTATNIGPGAVSSLQFVDVNGDGLVDMVQSSGGTNPVYLNTGEGSFIHMTGVMPTSSTFDLLTVADVNGDGRPDIELYPTISGGNILLRTILNTDAGVAQTGDAGNNAFMGDSSAESISGLAGDDSVVAGLGDDSVLGGDGNDIIYAGGGDDSVDAGTGDDLVYGGPGRNYLRGGDGNDVIHGGQGFDDINGNKGNDTLEGGATGHDWLVGGQGDDSITGAQADILWGNLGDDTLHGGTTDAQLRGGQGDDVIVGGSGNEFISGDRGNDTETGGGGADLFHTFNGAGIDRVLDFNSAEGDRVFLDPGTTYTVSQVGADTVIDLGAGDKMILVGVTLSTLPNGWIFGS
ncbi:MAG: VCBS repeat-containing protein [Proteobacteria bacterium]|nr:VCBS repeat-containing protein [Pseudomonadota bacterium]